MLERSINLPQEKTQSPYQNEQRSVSEEQKPGQTGKWDRAWLRRK